MSGTGKTLRVGILRLRCQEPRRYYVAVQSFPHNGTSSANTARLSSIRPEQGARTETSEPSRSPEFFSGTFVLVLPLPLNSIAPEQPLLRVELFCVPGLGDADAGSSQEGVLVGSGLVGSGSLGQEAEARLGQGQRVTTTVALMLEAGNESNSAGGGAPAALAAYEVLLELTLLDANSGNDSGTAEAVDTLVHECLAKQVALGKAVRQLDVTATQAEVVSWRLVDSEKRNRNLTEDNARLQQLLQAEQENWRIPQLRLLVDSAMLTREELIERCEAVMSAYGRERARNGELVERIKVLHSEQVDTLELKKRYQALQEAHEEQARMYGDTDGQAERMTQMRATVKTQEEIIRNLEALLAQAVHKVKPRAQDSAAGGDAEGDDIHAQLSAAEQRVRELDTELAVREAAAREQAQRMRQMEAELDALRQHTVTEFPVLEEAAQSAATGLSEDAAPLEEAPSQEKVPSKAKAPSEEAASSKEAAQEEEEEVLLKVKFPSDKAASSEEKVPSREAAPSEEPALSEEAVPLEGPRQTLRRNQSEPEGTDPRPGERDGDAEVAPLTQPDGDIRLQDTAGLERGQERQQEQDEGALEPQAQQQQQQQQQQPGDDGQPAEDTGGEAGSEAAVGGSPEERVKQLQERVKDLEAELEAARARIQELSEAGEGTKTAAEEAVAKLHEEVTQLTEEKTAAALRAEFSESAAEAAQNELVDVTRRYAREIAALKARLAEKEAAMMGGFGGLESLTSREDPPFPAFPPLPSSPGIVKRAATTPPTTSGAAGGSGAGSGVGESGRAGSSSGAGIASPRAPADPRISPVPPRTSSAESAGRLGPRQGSGRVPLRAMSSGPEREPPPPSPPSAPPVAAQELLPVPSAGQEQVPPASQAPEPESGGGSGEQAVSESAPEVGSVDGSGRPLTWMKSKRGRIGDRSKRKKEPASETVPAAPETDG